MIDLERQSQGLHYIWSILGMQPIFEVTPLVKVMFLQACVCPQGGVPDQVHPPRGKVPLAGTHPLD